MFYRELNTSHSLQRFPGATADRAYACNRGGSERPYICRRTIAAVARTIEGGLALGGAVATWTAMGLADDPHRPFIILALLSAVAVPVGLGLRGAYTLDAVLEPGEHAWSVASVWMIVFCVASGILWYVEAELLIRQWLIAWCGAEAFVFMGFRLALGRLGQRWNRNGQFERRVILVGGGDDVAGLVGSVRSDRDGNISILGIFDDRGEERSPSKVCDCNRLGTIDDLLEFVRRVRVDVLLVTFPPSAESRVIEILRKLWVLPVDIRLSTHRQRLRYMSRTYSRLGEAYVLDLSEKPIRGWGAILKGIEDKVLASIAIVLLLPLLATVWIAVRLDSKGPAIFKQKRYGFNNRLVDVYKFRSMYVESADPAARQLTTRDDPRVTRVGRFIRKTSLDELPQLFNVLKGELSMVGPRPQAPMAGVNDTIYADIVEEYFARTKVKPGITGWAQVNGWRGNTDTEEKIRRRVDLDLYYIANWSLLFDLYILALTPLSLLDTENAY